MTRVVENVKWPRYLNSTAAIYATKSNHFSDSSSSIGSLFLGGRGVNGVDPADGGGIVPYRYELYLDEQLSGSDGEDDLDGGAVANSVGNAEGGAEGEWRTGAGDRKIRNARAIDRVDNPHSFPSYDPMSDPHLSDYFARKFGYDPPSAVARRRAMYGPGAQGKQRTIYKPGSRPSSGRTKHSRRESGMMYKIVVRTADRKNAGTDARVFIKMKGTKGKIPKKRLYKKSGSVKDSKTSHFKFERGTKHTFKLRAADIGEITIEHDGLERKQSWLLESVTITNTASKGRAGSSPVTTGSPCLRATVSSAEYCMLREGPSTQGQNMRLSR
ncbi:uncharacterized protein LOC118424494 [Branchiostoma floridae]|uniref:Uncharacterized protein LOC118424494 n=1 Tax=Branchiostoma floridae TaxID=7739 RepID=A0A9J7N4B7_BRAFL|nr:uncharacterized protein LOC118424494 [Branchiostoma floridae]